MIRVFETIINPGEGISYAIYDDVTWEWECYAWNKDSSKANSVSLSAIKGTGWKELPLECELPILHCAECNAKSYYDYLCSECRNMNG